MSKQIYEISGFEELQQKIKKLGNDKDKRAEILKILRQASKSTIKAAQLFVPVSKKPHIARGKKLYPGNLKLSIGSITGKKGRSRINPTVYAGPRAKGKWDGWYGHMVEEGHNIYYNPENRNKIKKSGQRRSVLERVRKKNTIGVAGKVKGAFYMARAYEITKGKVSEEMENKVVKYIQKQIDKLESKGV